MNNSKTPKIVVGVSLAALYAAGLAYFTLNDGHDNPGAQTASSTAAQSAPASVAPTDTMAPPADSSNSMAEQPGAMTAAAASPSSAAGKPEASPPIEAAANFRSKPVTGQRGNLHGCK